MPSAEIRRCHGEVLTALRDVAPDDPAIGERIRQDRGSELTHLGVRTPVRRRIVKAGFSFTGRPDAETLVVWDGIWGMSDTADVLFAALDHYRDRHRATAAADFWPVARRWVDRLDNWAHTDDLGRVYSWALEARSDVVYPDIVAWSEQDDLWTRRVAIVSLVHYSGKHAMFLPPDQVVAVLEHCVSDRREPIQKAIGWVLREMSVPHPETTLEFLERHAATLTPATVRRARERLDVAR